MENNQNDIAASGHFLLNSNNLDSQKMKAVSKSHQSTIVWNNVDDCQYLKGGEENGK